MKIISSLPGVGQVLRLLREVNALVVHETGVVRPNDVLVVSFVHPLLVLPDFPV